jgi:hypothetical protein
MASNDQKTGVWDDDEKTVFFLPPSGLVKENPTPETEAEAAPKVEADVEPEGNGQDADIPFPWVGREDRQEPSTAAPPIRTSPDEEPFDRPGTTRVGLLGGKGVGKSYFFRSLVYRTLDGKRSGALSSYIDQDSVRVYETHDRRTAPRSIIPSDFIQDYTSWARLHSTTSTDQTWYRLRLPFRTGLLGRRRSFLDVDFLDGSGELFEAGVRPETEELWKEAFLEARVMVFCLPLWAAFPAAGGVLSDDDWRDRQLALRGFDTVVRHFKDLREKHGASHPVHSVLALTMADDRRSALVTLKSRWIDPFVEEPLLHLKTLRRGAGVARYLFNARKVSEALAQEFDASPDPLISGIPVSLELGAGQPWFVPVSAVDGAVLDAARDSRGKGGSGQRPPVPVHVELPLLVALCASHNALM